MENKLPQISKELLKQIEDEAETYSFVLPYDNSVSFYDHPKRNAYIAGATAYAHYKERWEQAKKALEEILVYCEESGVKRMAVENPVHMAIYHSLHTAKNTLASWKDEGKEGGGK